ncbi:MULTISPECIES: M42 family metallopeptidase [Persicobacter]|uniref:Peptidase M42 n=1 Tax=Persicobacter diffluens TaxID=981 RepID=A0AAN4VXP9_9BACT|nr:M42 family metallopeptidase [Persicobacter sp. CCB-QB2]GJM60260.1 peptidase M42 [Persicobacter diffluens]
MDQKSQEFLYKYLNANAPTGFEAEGQQIWLDYVRPYIDEYFVDNYGTVVGVVNPKADYKVVIEAHADEIAWYVNYIDDKGYLYVVRNGGSDFEIAPSMRVKIHGEKGVVNGVFGWPAIHVRGGKEGPKPNAEKLTIDVGAHSKEEVEALGIYVGTVITFDQDLMELNDRYLCGRALDNRIGGFMIAEVARRLKEGGDQLPFGLYIVNAVQEEVGLNGAKMVTESIKPNVAIVTDVCHDTQSPLYSKVKEGDFTAGKGPVLTIAPAVHNKLLKILMDTAKEKEIPFQRAASSRFTGTDTDAFAFSNGGVVSALISLPLKYMHTTVEMTHKEDVEHVIQLMLESLKKIEDQQDFRYFK